MATGCSSGWIRRNSRWVRSSPYFRPKLDTISETTRPAPWRLAWRRTNQLPMPASGASTTRFAIWTPPRVQESVSLRSIVLERLAPSARAEADDVGRLRLRRGRDVGRERLERLD